MPKKQKEMRRRRARRRNEERQAVNASASATPPSESNPVKRTRQKTQMEFLHARGSIGPEQRFAGERLYRDWYASGAQPVLVSASWSGVGHGKGESSDVQVVAHQRFVAAIRAVGLSLSGVLVDVCLWDASPGDWAAGVGKPRADGSAALRLALDALSSHYKGDVVTERVEAVA